MTHLTTTARFSTSIKHVHNLSNILNFSRGICHRFKISIDNAFPCSSLISFFVQGELWMRNEHEKLH